MKAGPRTRTAIEQFWEPVSVSASIRACPWRSASSRRRTDFGITLRFGELQTGYPVLRIALRHSAWGDYGCLGVNTTRGERNGKSCTEDDRGAEEG
jgi:hypothetical protein